MNQNCCGNSDRAFSEIFKTFTDLPLVIIALIVFVLICFVFFIGYFVSVQNDKRLERKRSLVEDKKLQ